MPAWASSAAPAHGSSLAGPSTSPLEHERSGCDVSRDPFLFSSLGEKNSNVFFLERRGMVWQRGKKGWRLMRFHRGRDLGVISVDDQRRLSASSLLVA